MFYATAAWAVWTLMPDVVRSIAVPGLVVIALDVVRHVFDFVKFGRDAAYHAWSSKVWGSFPGAGAGAADGVRRGRRRSSRSPVSTRADRTGGRASDFGRAPRLDARCADSPTRARDQKESPPEREPACRRRGTIRSVSFFKFANL